MPLEDAGDKDTLLRSLLLRTHISPWDEEAGMVQGRLLEGKCIMQ